VVQGMLDLVAGKPLLDQDVDNILDPRLAARLAGEVPDRLLYRPDDVALRLCDPRHNLIDIGERTASTDQPGRGNASI